MAARGGAGGVKLTDPFRWEALSVDFALEHRICSLSAFPD